MDTFSHIPVEFLPFVQICLALFFGMILGIERVLVGRTAGPRTYGLVAMGSCLVAIISTQTAQIYPGITGVDPLHFVASVVTGVGFIGAGLIMVRGSQLSGLTTAAGIWVAAIIGIAVGLNFYLLAFFTTFLTLFVFTIMWRIEKLIKVRFSNLITEIQHQDSE